MGWEEGEQEEGKKEEGEGARKIEGRWKWWRVRKVRGGCSNGDVWERKRGI